MTHPQLWIFAGPNGAGKSTLVEEYVRDRIPIVNPDAIASTLSPGGSASARLLRAGRMALRQRRSFLAACDSFGIETTLTGQGTLDLMRASRSAGYSVTLVYLGLRDVHHAIGRVRQRVARGGHDVPLADLMRRFDRSLANLPIAAALADRLIIIDNSGLRRRLVLVRDETGERQPAGDLPAWATHALM